MLATSSSSLPKTRAELEKWLVEYDACGPAMEWLAKQPAGATLEQLYETCPYGNYLAWVAHEAGVDIWTIVLAACDCARTVATTPEDRHALDLAVRRAQGDLAVTAEISWRAVRNTFTYSAVDYAATAARYADDASKASAAATCVAFAVVTAAYKASANPAALASIVRARIPFKLLIGDKK